MCVFSPDDRGRIFPPDSGAFKGALELSKGDRFFFIILLLGNSSTMVNSSGQGILFVYSNLNEFKNQSQIFALRDKSYLIRRTSDVEVLKLTFFNEIPFKIN